MAIKTLSFDVTDVTIRPQSNSQMNIEIETNYPDEIINGFNNGDIIDSYYELDDLYEELKKHYGDE